MAVTLKTRLMSWRWKFFEWDTQYVVIVSSGINTFAF